MTTVNPATMTTTGLLTLLGGIEFALSSGDSREYRSRGYQRVAELNRTKGEIIKDLEARESASRSDPTQCEPAELFL